MSQNPQPHQLKTVRRRLQRQLEFYLSESNLQKDKYLHQHQLENGYYPLELFLSFNKIKAMHATPQMVLDAVKKSRLIKFNADKTAIAPIEQVEYSPYTDTVIDRTIYIDRFSPNDDHDSLRKIFARFGTVTFISLPRYHQTSQFKGFGFIEFKTPEEAQQALKALQRNNKKESGDGGSEDGDLLQMYGMSKQEWLDLREKMKEKLEEAEE